MRHPTPAEVEEYHRRLDAVIVAEEAGLTYDKLAADLTAFMVRTGFGEELPPTEFPELAEPNANE